MNRKFLSEEEASALLAEWLDDEHEYQPKLPPYNGLVHMQIEVRLQQREDDDDGDEAKAQARREGVTVRRAMEGINALACCRGFSVEENEVFWRRQFRARYADEGNVSSSPFHPFDRTMFSRFHVELDVDDTVEITAAAVVACCATDSNSAAMQARAEIHRRLAPFLAWEPPMLDVEINPICEVMPSRTTEGEIVEPLSLCLQEVGRIWKQESLSANPRDRVVMVCNLELDADSIDAMLEIAAMEWVELRKLDLGFINDEGEPLTSELSSLMQALVRADKTVDMAWQFSVCDRAGFAAVFSAIPAMKALKSFSVIASDQQKNGRAHDYYTWLAYALFACRREKREVAITMSLPEDSGPLFAAALQSPTSLLDALSSRCGDRLTIVPYGSSALVRASTKLTTEITRKSKFKPKIKLQTPKRHVIAAHDQRVDVLATFESVAVVMWPGIGLLSTAASSLVDSATPTTDVATLIDSVLTVVNFRNSDLSAIAAFFEHCASCVRQLCIDVEPGDNEAFQRILRSCRCLQTLYGSMESIEPLLVAYANGNCSISSLSLSSVVSEEEIDTLIEALSDKTSRVHRVLKRLCLESTTFGEEQVAKIAAMLASNRQLEYLRLAELMDEEKDMDDRILHGYEGFGRELLYQFVDEPIGPTPKSLHAAHAFLFSAKHDNVMRALPLACMQQIVRFAAMPMRRHVSWEERV